MDSRRGLMCDPRPRVVARVAGSALHVALTSRSSGTQMKTVSTSLTALAKIVMVREPLEVVVFGSRVLRRCWPENLALMLPLDCPL